MRYKLAGLFCFCLVCIFIQRLNGQTPVEMEWPAFLTQTISQKGYQNVSVTLDNKIINISYENRVQRFEPRAIIEIIQAIGTTTFPDSITQIQLITQRLQLPMLKTIFSKKDLEDWQSNTISLTTFINRLVIQQGEKSRKSAIETSIINSGNYRIELELKPQIGLGLGGFPDPVLHRLYAVPTLNAYLWKGAQIQLETILPITSEFNIIGEHFIRPGVLSFTQNLKLTKGIFVQGTLGYFTNNRYGGQLSFATFFWNGSLAITGKVGYTGYASYPQKRGLDKAKRGWEYQRLNYLDYQIGINYWLGPWNTQVRLEYGRALFGKEQIKFTCLQRFNEVDIGFFAFKSQRGNNYGMQLNLPIFPKKYRKPKRFSVRPANHLNYTYQATQKVVETYTTGNSILGIHRQLNPEFVKQQLLRTQLWQR